jgi:hypothetical protein
MFNVMACFFSSTETGPFKIAIYEGEEKPRIDDLLDDIVDELMVLGPSGVKGQEAARERGYYVRVRVLRADGPARSMVKCTKGHSGYNACERCISTGKIVVESTERLLQRIAQQSEGARIAAAAAKKFRNKALAKNNPAPQATKKKPTSKKGKKGKGKGKVRWCIWRSSTCVKFGVVHG